MEDKIPLLYQDIAAEISYDKLPQNWIRTNLTSFSKDIQLFDYQQLAVKNTINFLYNYFESVQKYQVSESEDIGIERKKEWYSELEKSEKTLLEKLGYLNKNHKTLFQKIERYYETEQVGNDKKIHFFNFVNRMSFWMATGSGKTIILVKLIEILTNLIDAKLIPDNDILILTPREDLIDQIKTTVDEFNRNSTKKIEIWPLNRYDDVKNGSVLTTGNLNVFIYKSDLFSEKTKVKQIGFEDFENDGKWYVLLDEAHKGDSEDSKRQLFYSLFSRNGFLFNFSATFTDPWDILTTVCNFNLDTFIQKGYGKNVYLSQQEFEAFKTKGDFANKEKQKIVLKSLILLSIAKNSKTKINEIAVDTYHNPMLVALVNSVNIDDSDLEMFFRELEKIAIDDVDKKLFEDAKKEIISELKNNSQYVFGKGDLKFEKNSVEKISIRSLRENIFNSASPGKIEVIKIPGNNNELIFRLKSSTSGSLAPFAIIKIGDVLPWLKKLVNYEITSSISDESYFKSINNDNSSVNILMGSRSFYEGWDTNRPNVMLFINIGIGDAKKYVTQSIGRGVRIQPIPGKRKRLIPLKREGNTTAKNMIDKLASEDISVLETLFVLGTNKQNVQDILDSIKYERKTSSEIIELQKNNILDQKEVLIPTYKEKSEILDVAELPKFNGNKKLLSSYIDWLKDDRLIYAQYSEHTDVTIGPILQSKKYLQSGTFADSTETDIYYQLKNLIKHTNLTLRDLDKFKQVEDEISHFKKIGVTLDENQKKELTKKIEKVKNFQDPAEKEKDLDKQLVQKVISLEKYKEGIKQLSMYSNQEDFTVQGNTFHIKHMLNHYYVPIIVSEQDKVDYIKHIITVKSEKIFLEQVENFVKNKSQLLDSFDWWMFCKIDEHLDEVHIPYHNPETNSVNRFKPDFIFWLKKGKQYFIIFVDPKGTKHTDYQFKVDGYSRIFEENGEKKLFHQDGISIKCYLYLHTDDTHKLAKNYKKYWFDEFADMIKEFLNEQK